MGKTEIKRRVLFLLTVSSRQPRNTWADSLNWGLPRSGRPASVSVGGGLDCVTWWVYPPWRWVRHFTTWAGTVYEGRKPPSVQPAASMAACSCLCSQLWVWWGPLELPPGPGRPLSGGLGPGITVLSLLYAASGQSCLIAATEVNSVRTAFVRDRNSRHLLKADVGSTLIEKRHLLIKGSSFRYKKNLCN